MGTFSIPFQVGNSTGRRFVLVEALVDTGTTHTLLPRTMLNELGVEVLERLPFHLADERTVEYDLGEARVRLGGQGTDHRRYFRP